MDKILGILWHYTPRKAGWLQTAAWMEVVAKVAAEAAWRRDATVQLYSGLLKHSNRGYEVFKIKNTIPVI